MRMKKAHSTKDNKFSQVQLSSKV